MYFEENRKCKITVSQNGSKRKKNELLYLDFTCVLTTVTEFDGSSMIITESSSEILSSCSVSGCTPGTKPVVAISPLTESGNIGSICSDKVLAKYSLNFDLRLLFV